jgi:phosphoribosylglycinamide formyltransferase-1
MKNIVILISGRGSNMEAVVQAAQAEGWPAKVAAVISNRADAPGLAFAAEHGIKTAIVANKDYASRAEFDAALQTVIDGFEPDLVVLAGFMRILTVQFRRALRRPHAEHPSIAAAAVPRTAHAPAGAGRRAWLEHGATVHFVTAELDHGPSVLQARMPVLPGDTEEPWRSACWPRNMSFIRKRCACSSKTGSASRRRSPHRRDHTVFNQGNT